MISQILPSLIWLKALNLAKEEKYKLPAGEFKGREQLLSVILEKERTVNLTKDNTHAKTNMRTLI